ncbi:MAG: NAD(+) diphosphatase [Spirochaetales bacterium]
MRFFSRAAVPSDDDLCLVLVATKPQFSVAIPPRVPGLSSGSEVLAERGVWQVVGPAHQFFLGERDGNAVWVLVVAEKPRPLALEPLRQVLARAEAEQAALLNRAVVYAYWLQTHQFCGTCGTPLVRRDAEFALVCPRCEAELYPRLNPCVIMLVYRGDEILLARHARSIAAPVFSCLAGYVEAGETLEATVAREVREEVNVEVGKPVYVESQPWPFPSQLMAGFLVPWKSGEPTPDGLEIVEAGWFGRDSLPALPPSLSLARRLIRRFYNDNSL